MWDEKFCLHASYEGQAGETILTGWGLESR